MRPYLRNRLVGRKIKEGRGMDLFAATPPLDAFKHLESSCAQQQGGGKPMRLAVFDVNRAYFYAPTHRVVFIETLQEDREAWDEVNGAHAEPQLIRHAGCFPDLGHRLHAAP